MPIRSTQSFTNELIPSKASDSIPLDFPLLVPASHYFPFPHNLTFSAALQTYEPGLQFREVPPAYVPRRQRRTQISKRGSSKYSFMCLAGLFRSTGTHFHHFFLARAPKTERPRGLLYHRPLTPAQYNLAK